MKIKTRPWDPADHLKTKADMAAYLSAALEYGDPNLISAVRSDIARAKRLARMTNDKSH